MDHARRVRIAMAIAEAARADGPPVRLPHVCQATVAVVGVSGASLSVVGDLGFGETVYATDAISEHTAELETVLGVGPAIDALTHGDPVWIADVSRPCTPYRWPRLGAVLSPLSVVALFAFPLIMSDITVGVLELYRTRPAALTRAEVADAEVFAEAAVELMVDIGLGDSGHADEVLLGPMDTQWAVINQAVGFVSAQLDQGLTEAYLRLRAYAYLSGCRLLNTAEAVLAGDLRFAPDHW
jgi:hypothetical protein